MSDSPTVRKPDLPTPTLARWQPLRLGLVDLFHYDSEEFWFRDGHLLLRGNNGTGKSKVLSLTLPFLFDAQLKSARIEPDGDARKKMSWNLLLDKHDRRIGYAWIEFGRIDESGHHRYLTLGSGLSAVAARPQVDCWFFLLTSGRIGQDFWLTTPQQVVLTKERLKVALEGLGQVFETALSYRRAVDEQLFHLGVTRYAALMDTLIQLRQPQLSKKPDEGNLSDALTEALPPLATDLLSDVADALNQLEEDRHQLEEYQALARAIGQFNDRYRLYTGTQTRRQARTLRSAQTGFDNASRAVNEAGAGLMTAKEEEDRAISSHADADSALRASRARLQMLQSDPVMQDANRLALAEKEEEDRRNDAVVAEHALNEAKRRLDRETGTTRERGERGSLIEKTLTGQRVLAHGFAGEAGIADLCAQNLLFSGAPVDLTALDSPNVETAHGDARQFVVRRREQIALLHRRFADFDQTGNERKLKAQAHDERCEELAEITAQRDEADAAVERQGRALVDAWQAHFEGLQQLRADDFRASLEALAAWVGPLQGGNPARAALQAAQQQTSERLAQSHAALMTEQEALRSEQATLQDERERLRRGEETAPPASIYRTPGARIDRAGAPLWQLVEFRNEVDDQQRAGIEAALEVAGLLDAWITPDGRLRTSSSEHPLDDTHLLERERQSASLTAWLKPSESLADAEPITRLLEGIACTPEDTGTAESWISPTGKFRLGALAGQWSKPVAAYIGYAARAAARARRLEAVELRLSELAQNLADLQTRLTEHTRHQQQAAEEWQSAPADDALRAAHAHATSCAAQFQTAGARVEQATQQLRKAEQSFKAARDALAQDAQDLHLPDTRSALDEVSRALTDFSDALFSVFQAACEFRLAHAELQQQREREQEARMDAENCAARLAERRMQAREAQTRRATLREAVGAKVEQLQERLADARKSVADGEKSLDEQAKTRRLAGEERARAEQKAQDAELTLQERSANRQQAVVHLQGFAATGLLSTALPGVDVPDLRVPWTIEPALQLARRAEQALSGIADHDDAWTRIQNQISQDFSELGRALTALSHQAQAETSDYGLVVSIVYQNRPERPDQLALRLDDEISQRRELLTAREREVLENHLQAEIAAALQRLMQDAQRQVEAINKELYKRPTSTGVRFRLQWLPLPEGAEGAPVGLDAARKRLLNTDADLWSAEDKRVVGALLHQRIAIERANADTSGGGSMLDQLARALDYRRWHRFSVQRWQDGQWRKLSGPASSGERALGLTVPLFAAVASYYTQSNYDYSPRLVLLDEAFAGIDDAARAHCMALVREFDLDFVITSEREWACYAELPGVSICELQRREGIDAIYVSRWTWDGRAKRRTIDPDRRFPDA